MTYLIQAIDGTKTNREPEAGKWYAGINAAGQTGLVAKFDGQAFANSMSDDLAMGGYVYLAELKDILPVAPY